MPQLYSTEKENNALIQIYFVYYMRMFEILNQLCFTNMIIIFQALDTFNTAIVSPIYYVMFTTLTILASVIMFKVSSTSFGIQCRMHKMFLLSMNCNKSLITFQNNAYRIGMAKVVEPLCQNYVALLSCSLAQ